MIDIESNFFKIFPKKCGFIFLHSHPDDESFLNAGFIQFLVKFKKNVHIIYTSAGLVKNIQLTSQRQKEAYCACNKLGLNQLVFLNYCDNLHSESSDTISTSNPKLVANEILKITKEILPEGTVPVFVSYDRNGGYGHVDHQALHEIGKVLISLNHLVIESTMNRDLFFNWIKEAQGRIDALLIPLRSYWSDNPWLQAKEITHCYVLKKDEIETKKQTLLAHKSQIHFNQFPAGLDESDYQDIFGVEYFRISK
jgi:LmbE family N-acetylglucosaminyl deacetylase